MALLDIEIGDRVFCIHYGWGVVRTISGWMDYPIEIYFDSGHSDSYNLEGKIYDYMIPTLSFTEYKLEGFSQERPEVLPNKGDVVWAKNSEDQEYLIGHFHEKSNDGKYVICFRNPHTRSFGWKFDEIITKNPYKNEDSI